MALNSSVRHRHSRRRFLQVSGAMGFTVAASAQGAYAVAQTPEVPSETSQAPVLDDQDLPPVVERIGEQPLVVQPLESIGQYGGTWRSGLIGGQDTAWLDRTIGYDHLVSWSPDWSEVVPNIARSFSVSDDGRSYSFELRPGMRWSDGEPFTTADVEFYVNNVYRNEQLTTSLGTNPFTIEVHDEVSFTLTYEEPNGFVLQDMAQGEGLTSYPRHYLEQFHIDFNPDGIDALVEENGAADWIELFRLKGAGIPGTPYTAIWSNADLPRLHAWRLVEPYGEGTRVRFERNPYYWKVDPEGQQLPYIDEVVFDVLEDAEVLLLRAANGEIDLHSRHINTLANKPVLAESRESGGYEFFDLEPAPMNTTVFALNLTHKNEALREVFQNLDFRIGLSHAINRQEIIDAVFVSQGEPWQLAPRAETPWYNETLAKQYTEYDVDLANEMLDRVLPDKDGDGMRLMPNGEPFSFVVEVTPNLSPAHVDVANLVVDYWKTVGVNASLKTEDRSLMFTRRDANEHDCMVWLGDGGSRDAILWPKFYFPMHPGSLFAIAWYIWYEEPSNPQAEPMEPPARVREQMDLYDQIERTPDPEAQNELFNELLEISAELFYAIGISLPAPGYGIRKINLRNVPSSMPESAIYVDPGPTVPAQYFFEQ